MNPLRTWQKYVQDAEESIIFFEKALKNETPKNPSGLNWGLYRAYRTVGINDLSKGRISDFKKKIYHAASLALYCYTEFNHTWYESQSYPYGLALMSGNRELIDEYAKMEFKSTNKRIKTSYLIVGYKALINHHEEKIQEVLKIIDKNIERKKEVNLSFANKLCITGIMENDTAKIMEGIKIFEQPRQKNRLIKNERCEEIISINPIIYLKIAEIRGVSVDFTNESNKRVSIGISST